MYDYDIRKMSDLIVLSGRGKICSFPEKKKLESSESNGVRESLRVSSKIMSVQAHSRYFLRSSDRPVRFSEYFDISEHQ